MRKLRTMTQAEARGDIRRRLAGQFPHLFARHVSNDAPDPKAAVARTEDAAYAAARRETDTARLRQPTASAVRVWTPAEELPE